MKQGIGAAVAAIAMLLAGVGGASAHTTEFDSFVFIENGGFGKGSFVDAYGFSFSKVNEKCIPNRRVKLRLFGEGLNPVTADSALTSANGGFYLRGFAPDPGYDTATVKMPSKNIGRNGHKHICAADSAFVDGPV
jgi:hypothetical protein